MSPRNSIIVIEDRATPCDSVRIGLTLSENEYAFHFVSSEQQALQFIEPNINSIALLLWHASTLERRKEEFLATVKELYPDLPLLVILDFCSPEVVAAFANQPARRLLAKPVTAEQVDTAIRSMAHGAGLSVGSTTRGVTKEFVSAGSLWSQQIEPFLDMVTGSDMPVLIQGETGVGKEVIARAIHARSERALRPFVKLNCAALPAELVESELFGYERGAFTGAYRSTGGKFELAQRGVILLDEIGDMEFRLQAKLLQVLQDQQFYSLGAKEPTQVDVRVIAATHCDLELAMMEGRFREDLYYRLGIATIYIPPLRERPEDIPVLAEHFLNKHCRRGDVKPELTRELQEALFCYDWPGNVRELENIMRRYLLVRQPKSVIDDLFRAFERRRQYQNSHRSIDRGKPAAKSPWAIDGIKTPDKPNTTQEAQPDITGETPRPNPDKTFADIESQQRESEMLAILNALDATRWNRKQAANLLKVNYNVFLYRMKRLGITTEAVS